MGHEQHQYATKFRKRDSSIGGAIVIRQRSHTKSAALTQEKQGHNKAVNQSQVTFLSFCFRPGSITCTYRHDGSTRVVRGIIQWREMCHGSQNTSRSEENNMDLPLLLAARFFTQSA